LDGSNTAPAKLEPLTQQKIQLVNNKAAQIKVPKIEAQMCKISGTK
jgi:hypothetical protein